MKKGSSVFKTALFMVAATMLSKVFGMLRDVLLASHYGTSYEAIAYETASRLPILLFDFVLGGVVTASFVPIFNEILVKKSKEEALDYANRYVNLVLLITAAISAVGVIFAGPLVSFLAPDISENAASLAVPLTRIMFPMVIFTGLAFSFVGILQSLGEFNLPAVISLVSNGAIVLYFVFLDRYFGIWGLSVAMLVGWVLQAAVQIPRARSLGYRYKPTLSFSSPYIKRSLLMAFPILVSTWAQPVCTVINTRFASSLEDGRAIIALGYSNRLNIIIVGVFSFVATNLLFPLISRATTSGDTREASRLTNISVKMLLLVIFPITVGATLLAEPIIALIYGRGEFGASDISLTALALRFLALGMPFMAINEVQTKLFFAKQKTGIPMISALVSMAVNFVFALVFSKSFGISGIATAASIAVAANTVLNYIFLRRMGEDLFEAGDLLDMIKMLVASLVMGTAAYFTYAAAKGFGNAFALVLAVLAGAALYGVLVIILGWKKYTSKIVKEIKNDKSNSRNK